MRYQSVLRHFSYTWHLPSGGCHAFFLTYYVKLYHSFEGLSVLTVLITRAKPEREGSYHSIILITILNHSYNTEHEMVPEK